jgi:hypothetical protein
VAEVLGSGFLNWLACRGGIFRPKNAALLLVLGSSLLIPGISVAAQSGQSPQAKKPSPSVSNLPPAEPQSPPPAQIWLPPLQAPEHAPVISWDGKLLTIDAENSSLSDILLEVRSRSGASIEMPASTSRERIAAHLGPAPIRDVLSSLLYGTNFNYVIQSADDDETALGKVILTARESDKSGDTSAEDTVAADGRPNPKIRLMPGYAAPGKRDFEVAHSNAADDSASTAAETPASADSSSSSPDQTATATDGTNQQNDTQPATANASDSTSPTDPTSLTAAEQPISGSTAGTLPANDSNGSSSGGGTTLSQMEQNMQRLYQQRQQLQAQQGRAAQTPAP